MARQNHGPLSRAKGKLGGVVYQQYEGMQISREYQPNVKNPQSESQVTNRADFKLASQAVAMFKEVINARLGRLSIYTRTRRGAALEALKRIATSDGNDGREINFDNAISAINEKSLTEYGSPEMSAGTGTVEITAPADSHIIGVIAGFDGEGKFVGRKPFEGTGTSAPVSFSIPSEFTTAKVMAVYTVVPEVEGKAKYSNIQDPKAVLKLDIARLIANGDLAVSDIAGTTVEA